MAVLAQGQLCNLLWKTRFRVNTVVNPYQHMYVSYLVHKYKIVTYLLHVLVQSHVEGLFLSQQTTSSCRVSKYPKSGAPVCHERHYEKHLGTTLSQDMLQAASIIYLMMFI